MMATMNSAPPPRRPTRHNGGVEVDHSRWNQLADIAQIVAIRAADLLDSGLERDDLVFETKSSATDMVSQMDRMTEQLIVDHLLAVRPADGILGEEGGEHHGHIIQPDMRQDKVLLMSDTNLIKTITLGQVRQDIHLFRGRIAGRLAWRLQ